MIEALGHVPGHLEVLLLVLAHGHEVGAVDQDVRRHQHGIREESVVHRESLGHLVLVGMGALEQSHGRHRGQDPGEFADFRQIRLAVEDGALGVDDGHGVVVGDEVDRLALFLELDVLADGAEIVADVALARGGDPGENPHHSSTRVSQ